MSDVCVTVPKSFGLQTWIDEGSDLPGNPWSGEEWHFYLAGPRPKIQPGERVYIVYNGKLRGYAPLVRIETDIGPPSDRVSLERRAGDPHRYALVRHGGAVACTIDRPIPGFRGFRYRDWEYADERPFPEWMIA